MLLVTLLWSTAGVVTRQLEAARSFELTFWRSAFCGLAMLAGLRYLRGPALWRQLLAAPRLVWLSGVCWAVMFTAFMLAISLTQVAHVLIIMALGPLLTALFARLFLQQKLPARTWIAIALASLGIAWMFGHELLGGTAAGQGGAAGHALLGSLVALGVPVAAAVNWCVLQHVSHSARQASERPDMLLSLLLGAGLSALCMLPLAWPLQASAHDLALLAGLGVFQLALPCLLVVHLSRYLVGPEIALLGQLEVILGVLWAWAWAGETPTPATLSGGALVLLALLGNELLAWRAGSKSPAAASVKPENLENRREA